MKFQDTTFHCFIQNLAWKKDLHRILLKYKMISTMSMDLHQTNNHKEKMRTVIFFLTFF